MIHEYSPIEIGLDALGVEPGQNPSTVFGVDDLNRADQMRIVGERIEQAMSAYLRSRLRSWLPASMSSLMSPVLWRNSGVSLSLNWIDLWIPWLRRIDKSTSPLWQ